jgi:hypothetical protein
MSRCETPGCTGHLGKFDDCLSEALYDCALDDASNWVGSTDFGISAAFLSFDDGETLPIGDGGTIAVPPGFYAVAVDASGFVYKYVYESETEQVAERERIESAYAEWDAEESE